MNSKCVSSILLHAPHHPESGFNVMPIFDDVLVEIPHPLGSGKTSLLSCKESETIASEPPLAGTQWLYVWESLFMEE